MIELLEFLHSLLAPYEVEANIFAGVSNAFRGLVELHKLKKNQKDDNKN